MKKIVFMILLCLEVSFSSEALNQTFKPDLLTGDTRLACEAILCLSSPVRPSECNPAIARYFGIHFKKPWKTIQARINFLNLCPIDYSQDKNLEIYKNEILPNLDEDCSVGILNNRVEEKKDAFKEIYCHLDSQSNSQVCQIINKSGFRINPSLTKSCSLLSKSIYTDFNLKYTCSKKFYTQEEWFQSKEALNEVSSDEYQKLPENLRISLTKWEKTNDTFNSYRQITRFYKAKPIQKTCWINEK